MKSIMSKAFYAICVLLTACCISYVTSVSYIGNLSFAQSNTNKTNSLDNQAPTTSLNISSARGSIASLQNDESAQPTWIISGQWNITNPTQSNQSNTSNAIAFHASLAMVKTDGTERHRHKISDFKLSRSSTIGANAPFDTAVLNGTSTLSMVDGPPREDVPTGIKLMNRGAISIWLDPSAIDNHFGNTPIYGTMGTFKGTQ
jgi:hypothetical protein